MVDSVIKAQNNLERKKIAMYYPAFLGGGAECVALWMLEALKEKYDLTLFTITEVNFDKLNSMYGTKLSEELVEIKYLSSSLLRPTSYFLIANNNFFRKLFIHLLIRYFKANQKEYDLLLSGYNAVDMGRSGIQYIHWIRVNEGTPFHHKISDFSEEQIKTNISVANSHCVADTAKTTYGVASTVIYPPVVINVSDIPWEQKEDAFVCSGRLTEAKAPHKVIRVLSQVREKGFNIKLYLTGGGGGVYAWKYKRFLKQMVEENSDWVTLYENLKYKDYVNVLSKCKYGIHFKKEPFGISIAEMMKAGAIPFVQSRGGQIEIVGEENQELFFSNETEAVERIINVLSNSETKNKLLRSLQERRNHFSTDKFMSEINKVVESYFELSKK